MKKKLIIILSISIVLILGSIVTFAAFMFNRTVTNTATTGDITIEKEGYVSYSLNEELLRTDFNNETEFKAILRERAGGLLVDKTKEDDLSTTYGNYYLKTETEASSYQENTIYYLQDDTGNLVYRDIDEFEDGKTYYTITYTKAISYDSSKDYYRVGHKYDSTVTSQTSLTDYYTYSGVDKEGYAIFQSAEGTTFSDTTKYYKLCYIPKAIQATGVINDSNEGVVGVACVNTYGTERTGSLAETSNYMYLNQVAFEFSIKTKISCYVRIKFRDAWVSSKLYHGSSTPQERYTSKRLIQGRSPFYVDDSNWYFDTVNNVAYLKTYINASDTSYNYSFFLDPSYFYTSDASNYTERMIIQVSYSLEVIQANRAKKVWKIDPREDLPND